MEKIEQIVHKDTVKKTLRRKTVNTDKQDHYVVLPEVSN